MMKNLLATILFTLCVAAVEAQTVILDFETPGTSTTFQYFGSTLDGTLTQIVPNPNASGENTSATVTQFVKPAVAEVWAGAFSNPNPATPVDLTVNDKVAIKVYMDHIGSLSLKLENSTDGGSNWIITVPNTRVNEWETLIFDTTIPSIEAPNAPAAGHTYSTVTLFFDFGTAGTGVDVTNYLDDVEVLAAPPVITTVLDFETADKSTDFQYFGSTLDGTFTNVILNPDQTGENVSDSVVMFVKPAVAEVWAGAFSNPNPLTPVILETGSQICIDVWMDHIGNLALKLEQGASGQANWITTVANKETNQWTRLCFDPSVPSIEAPNEPATGQYNRIVLFFDFGTAGTGTDEFYYFDNIEVESTGAPVAQVVHFKVDMNSYAENFDSVFVSGSFNSWSGNANPLADPEFDGVWEGDIMMLNGAYEYKFTLDNWNAQEAFLGLEECTKRDPSGQFVNRLLLVSGETTLPVYCYNSCYACGQEVQVTIRLGVGVEPPSPDGVWLAGGGNFEVPGGRFKMEDPDGDAIYEITFPRDLGFESYYTFTNGNCPDYSCKEDLTGLPCGDPNNFNDRHMGPLTGDLTIETCFETCAESVSECFVGTNDLQRDETVFKLIGNPPTNGKSILEFGDQLVDDKIMTLTNVLGTVVQYHNIHAGIASYELNTQSLPSGMYFVTVTSGDRFFTRKLMK